VTADAGRTVPRVSASAFVLVEHLLLRVSVAVSAGDNAVVGRHLMALGTGVLAMRALSDDERVIEVGPLPPSRVVTGFARARESRGDVVGIAGVGVIVDMATVTVVRDAVVIERGALPGGRIVTALAPGRESKGCMVGIRRLIVIRQMATIAPISDPAVVKGGALP